MNIDTAGYCKRYIERELASLKENKIWNSWHPVIERALERHDEMASIYQEIMEVPGFEGDFLVQFDKRHIGNSALQLTLETFWYSKKQYDKEAVAEKRGNQKELAMLHERMQEHALNLAADIRLYNEILEQGGYEHESYVSVVELIDLASEGNGHYDFYLKDELESLRYQFDGKYWPKTVDLVQALAEHYSYAPIPRSTELPSAVMEGRQARIKDYVLAVDRDLQSNRQIPSFKLSHSSMATLVNVVLDIPVDEMVSGETVRQIRHRHQKSG
ncbi:hypothetical protein [Enterovibrio paralichthyis]|uniref:hypothetical protein n=1 Tax=Enterovibrio paralichthyis TaxID=2853805 RepID=UPI001C45F3CE|nr:hypothetical protein [Enterovibrio paralichthyis]MBV7297717.1 hypothetical protein [Enterovibrio paralichthyis]